MFKRILFITLSLVMVFSLSAFAGEGSDTVGGGKLLPQLRYEYSANEWKTNDTGIFEHWDFKAHSYYAQVNWGIFNNADLIVLIGGRSLRMESEVPGWDINGDAGPGLLVGLGTRVTFFRADNGFYAGGGVLFTASFDNEYTVDQYTGGVLSGRWDNSYSLYSVVPELHVGYHLKNIGLTPYLGVDAIFADAHSDYTGDFNTNWNLEDPVYMFTGVDYFLMDKLYINVEGRTNFNDGWGVGTGVGYLFDICAKPAPAPAPAPAPVIEPKLEPMSKN
jgi:hypothetical protein